MAINVWIKEIQTKMAMTVIQCLMSTLDILKERCSDLAENECTIHRLDGTGRYFFRVLLAIPYLYEQTTSTCITHTVDTSEE